MLRQSAGDSGLWEGRAAPSLVTALWFTHVTHPRTNLMLFFAIEHFGEEVVSCFSLRAEDEVFL